MIYQIISRTPVWVWALFALLVWLGIVQSRPRTMSLARVVIIPAVLTILSMFGTVSAFGATPLVLITWIVFAVLFALFTLRRPQPVGDRFDPKTRQLHVMGSWVPLALMMGIFANKYIVGVSLGMQPELARALSFSLVFSAIYGTFSGVFIGRAARLWKLQTMSVPSGFKVREVKL
jgi:hypothetical protein